MLPAGLDWIFYPLDGGGMIQVNVYRLYKVGQMLHGIRELKDTEPRGGAWKVLIETWAFLATFQSALEHAHMDRAKEAAQALMDTVSAAYHTNTAETLDEPYEKEFYETVRRQLKSFDDAFQFEAERSNVFAVPKVGIYDTLALIERAEECIPKDIRARLSTQAIYDIRQAGKCLAFNIPTAAGMHILKAVESLIREYHSKLAGVVLPAKSRNWGAYIRDLSKHGADPQVVGYLQHIKDFYRNPILHPEVTLTHEQAQSLFNAALSAIVQLDAAVQGLSAGSLTPASSPSAPTP